MSSLLQRYTAGEHEQVWAELTAASAAVQDEPLYSAAREVAAETMRRARGNVEILVARLKEIGYAFRTYGLPVAPFEPSSPQSATMLAELEQLVGPLPLSIVAWYEIGGAVNLQGSHPAWAQAGPDALPDPLVVDPLRWVIEDAQDRLTDPDWIELDEPTYIYLAPDQYHKENISGGACYSLLIQPTADAPLPFEWHETTFVDYLRQAFAWGGFPGFARYPEYPREIIRYLAAGLAPV